MSWRLVLSCEHAGNRVPPEYRARFRGARRVLESHRGWDIGSLALARTLQSELGAPLFQTEVTRLLVEVNRSLAHRSLFSEFTVNLPRDDQGQLIERYYTPHRRAVEEHIAAELAAGKSIVHVSVHTFTPVLRGNVRNLDVGLLYDPGRPGEVKFCRAWRAALLDMRRELRVRRNNPYLGKADGFTTHLRRRFAPADYLGIELEVNQAWPLGSAAAWRKLRHDLAETLSSAVS